MIPLKLTLQGIQSYRERQEIDFSQLTAAGLFGVFGKVGSGKSTILEAITFCLFGDTERLNNRENRSYNLMNLRSDRLYIDFEFRIGRQPTTYRFVVEGKRNSKQFDKVTLERKAYQWMDEGNDWSPIATENPAERIIELTYENFKRTVIIPQGRFQEFIELKDADRTRMMKELFQLERFELADNVKKLNDINNNALAKIEGELKGLGEVTPEILAQTQVNLLNTNQLLSIEKNFLSKKREEEKLIEALKKLFDTLIETNDTLQKLQTQKTDFVLRAEKLTQYELFLQQFKPLLEEITKLTTRQNTEAQNFTKKKTQCDAVLQELTIYKNKLEILRPAYEKQHETRLQIADLRTLVQIKDLEADRNKLQARIKDGEEKLTAKQSELSTQQQNLQKTKDELAELRQTLPDVARLADIRKWFHTKDQLVKEREKLKADANGFVQQQNQIETEKQTLFAENTHELLNADMATKNYELIFKTIETAQNKLLTEAESLNTKLVQLHTQRALQQYAGTLTDGQPCPLCGSVHHPDVLKAATDLDTIIKNYEQHQKQLRKTANKTLADFTNKLTGLQQQHALIETQKTKLKTEDWPQKASEINAHEQCFVWTEFNATQREAVDKMWDDAEVLKRKKIKLEQIIEKENKEITEEEKTIKTKFETPLNQLRENISNKNGAIENAQEQLQNAKVADFKEVDAEILTTESKKLASELQLVIEKFEGLNKKINTQNQLKSELEGAIKSTQENLKQIEIEQKTAQETLKNTLLQQKTSSEDVHLVLACQIDIPQERKAVQEYEKNLFATEKEQKNLQEVTQGKTLDAEYYLRLLEEIEKHEVEQARLTQEVGRLTEEEKIQSRQIKQQAALLNQKTVLDVRKTDLDTMAKLFKASGFVNYVSSVYLQNLCNQANERFHRMTRQQLQLEINDTNNFQVRDLLNDGKTRALNTLSGGQKFQAALALALALADNVHTQSQAKENFFFLDEGFGSLDKESLQMVFDTLKSLRKENRIVGIISHVEDLQQEIDCYLHVTNEDERGSLVQIL